jgi:hypothetical protein
VTLIVAEGSLQWLNLIFYVVPNVLNAADPCFIFAGNWAYLGLARWTCWNTVSHLSLRSLQCHYVLHSRLFHSACKAVFFGKLLSCKGFLDAKLCCHASLKL